MIIEYEDKYLEDVRDLLVELEEYIVSIDEDNLDIVSAAYREKMALVDLEEIKNNNGKCYLYIDNKNVVGLIMGIIPKYDENDYLDYKCPKKGEVTELIIKKEYRNHNIGKILLNKMEEYFRKNNCEYSFIDVFAYNKSGINFYDKNKSKVGTFSTGYPIIEYYQLTKDYYLIDSYETYPSNPTLNPSSLKSFLINVFMSSNGLSEVYSNVYVSVVIVTL